MITATRRETTHIRISAFVNAVLTGFRPITYLSKGQYIRRPKDLPYPNTSLAVDTIAMSKEKGHETSSIASGSQPYAELYDPSKESVWTRVGVTWESFKRAPGTTGYGLPMIFHLEPALSSEDFCRHQWSDSRWQQQCQRC